jgi:hypothetical protein
MLAHNLTHLLTLKPGDFKRYGEIAAVHPQDDGPGASSKDELPLKKRTQRKSVSGRMETRWETRRGTTEPLS